MIRNLLPRPRPRPFAAISSFLLAVSVGLALTAGTAAAFKPGPHVEITRQGLGTRVSTDALSEFTGNLLLGSGNIGSDLHQLDGSRHIDSAPGPQAVCDRANAAWSTFYGTIRDSIQPYYPPDYDQLLGVPQARSAFGALLHALQDFYSHSNWVELFIAAGQSPPLATQLFPTCQASSLPAGLMTGYFGLEWGIAGCPYSAISNAWIPPAGFAYCHETLNKDSDQSLHGRELVPGSSKTYHALAAELAAAHTRLLYDTVRENLSRDWKAKYPEMRAICLVDKVMYYDRPDPCRLYRLSVRNISHSSGPWLTHGTVTLRTSNGVQAAMVSVSGTARVVTVPLEACLSGLYAHWQFFVADAFATPSPREITGITKLFGVGCDAQFEVAPERFLNYLIRYINADTWIAVYDLTVVLNNGLQQVPIGPVAAGTVRWIDLGPCTRVFSTDFGYDFIDPVDGATRSLTPASAPDPAEPTCLATFTVDLGGEIFGP
ncbi:hypothetical protein [Amaricoccus sp.]|uniref:hypothetical protein n=1 Tax=Amaricoccus sp. TaxID=1872485 RepID=UPI001B5E526D|nr:hypothetical protein [Amaricoccus sp.]MBP7002316.1 hypothetical protein [Amaricoccus sp.]